MNLTEILKSLSLTPALSGYEHLMAERMKSFLSSYVDQIETDKLGNLIATIQGQEADAPRIMLFAHIDQLGFVVRKIESDGFIRIERLGGVPEKALAGQPVVIQTEDDRFIPGIIGNKSHHLTPQEEKYTVAGYKSLYVDVGANSAEDVYAAGIDIGCPVLYQPDFQAMMNDKVYGTSIDNRGGCAILVRIAEILKEIKPAATVYIVGAVQEEFNLRGAMVAAQALKPDCAICVDINIAADTPDLKGSNDIALGAGPVVSMYNFHGRGTLNGTIPPRRMVKWTSEAAGAGDIPLQRGAMTGILTDASYVQLVDSGIPTIDIGFPARYSHSAVELCDMRDLEQVARLIAQMVQMAKPGASFGRE